jgi:glutamyl/glutaminyl-tRNA synthetase
LHIGNAWSFTLTWLAARASGGTVRLRIDDLDASRAQDEYLEDIFASLNWLGLDYDAGPRTVAEFKVSDSQRLRLDSYRTAAEVLKAGGHVYACACSRAAIRALGPLYPGTCRTLGLDLDAPEDHALRFRLPADPVTVRDYDGGSSSLFPARDMGDFVVVKRDGDPAYQLASVVDDQAHGVNFVVRGLDLVPSTGAQLALAAALGHSQFAATRFWHHPLVLDDASHKLSKSRGSDSLAALRERDADPARVMQWFAHALGQEPEVVRTVRGPSDLLSGFAPARVPTNPLRLSDFWRFMGDSGPA